MDEHDGKYSNEYSSECKGIIDDIEFYIHTLEKYFDLQIFDIEKLIILAEQENIGNKLRINKKKLLNVAICIQNDLAQYGQIQDKEER